MPMDPEKYEALKSAHLAKRIIRNSPFWTEAKRAELLKRVEADIAALSNPACAKRTAKGFHEFAERGKRRSCSEEERAAWKLARAVAKHAGALDEETARGLKQFIDLARSLPAEGRGLMQ